MPSTQNIVLVEDDPSISRLIETVLRPVDLEVITVVDGLEAVPLIVEVMPAVVLLDIALPGRNGWDVLTDLRELPQTAEIPIIVVTAHGQSGWKKKAAELGADGYIEKPFGTQELVDAVQTARASEPE